MKYVKVKQIVLKLFMIVVLAVAIVLFGFGTYGLLPANDATKTVLNEKLNMICADFFQTVKLPRVEVNSRTVTIKENVHKLVAEFDESGKLKKSKIVMDTDFVLICYFSSTLLVIFTFMMNDMDKMEKELQSMEHK